MPGEALYTLPQVLTRRNAASSFSMFGRYIAPPHPNPLLLGEGWGEEWIPAFAGTTSKRVTSPDPIE